MSSPPESGSHGFVANTSSIKDLMRSFSFELEDQQIDDADDDPENNLKAAFIDQRKERDRKLREARILFEPQRISEQEEIALLDQESNHLRQAWIQLRDELPADQRDQYTEQPPDVGDLIRTIQELETTFQSEKQKWKTAKIKDAYHRCCAGLNSHSNLLQALPAGNEYTSIFSAALQTLASVNYQSIAEGLSRALQDITEAVQSCVKECELFDTDVMKHNIAFLYAHIFAFLQRAVRWFTDKTRKRVLASLKEDFWDRFEKEITNIKNISLLVSREAQHASHAEVRYVRLQMEKSNENSVIGYHGVQRHVAEVRSQVVEVHNQLLKDQDQRQELALGANEKFLELKEYLGELSERVVRETFTKIMSEFQRDGSAVTGPGDGKAIEFHSDADSTEQQKAFLDQCGGRDRLQLHSRHLEDSILTGSVLWPQDEPEHLSFDRRVVSRLEEWTSAPESNILCVAGSTRHAARESMSSLASRCLSLAGKLRIPVVSFFIELPHSSASPAETLESTSLVSLTYSLIRQLIELVPLDTSTSSSSLNKVRFDSLDGRSNNLGDAFDTLTRLIELAPPILLIIIDGFQQLDDRSTAEHLEDLLRTLLTCIARRRRNTEGLVKILFTTAGRSRCLLDTLSTDEIVFAEDTSWRPGRPRRSGGPLSQDLLSGLGEHASNDADDSI